MANKSILKTKKEDYNIVIAGTGGQGVITLLQVLAEAALIEGKDIKTSELHGLSQRGGSVEVHVRFGERIYSPLVMRGKADLVIGLETQEVLRALDYAGPQTVFLVNKYFVPIPLEKKMTEGEIVDNLKKISGKAELIPASDICQESLGTSVVAGIYLICLAANKDFIPLKPESIKDAIKKVIPQKYLELNLKTFELAKQK
ncbi:MAG: indolepyruvate oxidoreductase subunit beta [Candidatus Pacebacteria bacterium]|nr:indolepyruvate oxidoreductase subunit beta [Candidatus Paceibacterota bacterium]